MLHLYIVNVSEVIIKIVFIKKTRIMAIRFRRVQRLCDPTNKEAGKKVYPVISYQYDISASLDEFAKNISSTSGVSEGETISALKDFRTLLRKTLLSGRSVNIAVWVISIWQPKVKEQRKRKTLPWRIFPDYEFVFGQIRIYVSLLGLQLVRID